MILLVRHCASSGQWPDAPLTAEGAEAAKLLAERLASRGVDAICSSPYARAVTTVQPLVLRLGLTIDIDPRLAERRLAGQDLADWLDHIRLSFDDPEHRAPGGESLREAAVRGLAALAEVAAAGHRLAVVASHGNLISGVLRSVDPEWGFEQWRRMANPDLFELSLTEGALTAYRRLEPE